MLHTLANLTPVLFFSLPPPHHPPSTTRWFFAACLKIDVRFHGINYSSDFTLPQFSTPFSAGLSGPFLLYYREGISIKSPLFIRAFALRGICPLMVPPDSLAPTDACFLSKRPPPFQRQGLSFLYNARSAENRQRKTSTIPSILPLSPLALDPTPWPVVTLQNRTLLRFRNPKILILFSPLPA